jgi:hypothetical protein
VPNQFAYFALIIWPLVTVFLCYRFKPLPAAFWGLVAASLFLPSKVAIDIQLLPNFDKHTIPSISLFVCFVVMSKARIRLLPTGFGERFLFLILLIAPILSLSGNAYPIYGSDSFIRGYSFYDSLSEVLSTYFFLIPFLLGMSLVKTFNDQRKIFVWLVCAGIVYSVPILLEVRLSPQLHSWVYGFFPHYFGQHVRLGGYRPLVFMGHGLEVAFFIATAVCSSAILLKLKLKILGQSALAPTAFLFVILLFCKSLGPLILSILFILLIYFSTPKTLKRCLIGALLLFTVYPIVLMSDLGFQQWLVSLFADLSLERADSLAFRFDNEKLLLAHAQEKLLFGWGSWGRNRTSGIITDSYWIITLGQWGMFGLISHFGLLTLAIVKSTSRGLGRAHSPEVWLCLVHALLLTIILVDQLVNASIASSGLYLFLFGSLCGRLKYIQGRRRWLKRRLKKMGPRFEQAR